MNNLHEYHFGIWLLKVLVAYKHQRKNMSKEKNRRIFEIFLNNEHYKQYFQKYICHKEINKTFIVNNFFANK